MSATTVVELERHRNERGPVHAGRSHRPSHPHRHTRKIPRPAGRMASDDLARLVELAAAGVPYAWEDLVHEFSGMVRAVARSHRLGDADVGDVAQATWLRLFEHLDGITEPARLGGWLATTARRESLRVLRAAQRHTLVSEPPPEEESDDASADGALITAERDVVLWRCFTRLRDRDQQLLHLLLAEPRLAYEEIAAALEMPIGSIGPRRARALERLRRELDDEGAVELVLAG